MPRQDTSLSNVDKSPNATVTADSPEWALVGCTNCSCIWVLPYDQLGQKKTAGCRRCSTIHQTDKLRPLETGNSKDEIREKRSRRLANRAGYLEEYQEEVLSYNEMEDGIETIPPLRQVSEAHYSTNSKNERNRKTDTRHSVNPIEKADVRQLSKGADARLPDVREYSAGEQPPEDTVKLEICPVSAEWTPRLIEELLPRITKLVDDLHDEYGQSWRKRIVEGALARLDDASFETTSEIQAFVTSLHRLRRYDEGLTELSPQEYESLVDAVCRLGSGRGKMNAGLEGLSVLLELFEYSRVFSIEIELQSEKWMDQLRSHPDTVERSLRAVSKFGERLDIWISPVAQRLRNRLFAKHAELVNGMLTEPHETPRPPEGPHWSPDEAQRAFESLSEFAEQPGHLNALEVLADGGIWTYEGLARDRRVDVEKNTVQKYVPELEEEGLVDIDDSARTHLLSISDRGRLAVGLYLAEGETIRPPRQLSLTGCSTLGTSRVSERDPIQEGIEDWLADFGEDRSSNDSSRYVQWLSVDGLQDITTHRRYSLISEVQDRSGVSLISHPELPSFSDGRKSRISCLEEHIVVSVEFGRSLPTLARICNSLLDPRLLSAAVSLDDVEDAVEDKFGKELNQRDMLDLLNKATQLGYLGEDEITDFAEWRERWSKIPPRLLSRLGDLNSLSGEALIEERGELYKRFHGAIASATALYRLAGNDITVQVRLPDVDGILRDEQLSDDLQSFVQHTIPKNALVGGLHSWNREHIEKDEDKLKKRITPDYSSLVAEGEEAGTSTVNWQFVGDKGTELLPIIENGIEEIEADVRTQVRDGEEDGLPLEIPVRRANHNCIIKKLIKRIANDKGWEISRGNSSLERIATGFESTLGTDTAGPSPISVATALLTLRGNRDGNEILSIGDVATGLSHLRTPELLPLSNNPTEKRLLSTILAATEPLSRTELIERASVSRGSTQHLQTLKAIELVEETEDGNWRATVEPWWSQYSDRKSPYERESQSTSPGSLSRWNHIVEHALERSGKIGTISVDEYTRLYGDGLAEALKTLGWYRFYPVLLHHTCDRHSGSAPGSVTTVGKKLKVTNTQLGDFTEAT